MSISSSCWGRHSADPPTSTIASASRLASVRTNVPGIRSSTSMCISERELKTFPPECASLRRDGVDKTCVRQAAAYSVATRHEATHTQSFFERGIAHSANYNPAHFMPPLRLHPKSP
ncbi:hypothetical protein B0H14DRAFT_3456801 [Mycena olivaceomarginata]|nr:hypothetical protein B0H14DRAFT_3516663 [Mycena olivaceomarginata]KAJ7842578.1 hypothetical protein B0H14DRAFT_3456801 [Mycena olivaceomarginata]